MCGIYKITNKINNKTYIGQSRDITTRWRHHRNYKSNYPNSWKNSPLYLAIEKYGIENFIFEIIEECSIEELNEKEIYWINEFNSYKNGYNVTMGGEGSLNFEFKLKEEDILKIYDLLANSNLSQQEIAKMFKVGEDVISTINHGKSRRHLDIEYPIRKNQKKYRENQGKIFCIDCGIEICEGAVRCRKCMGLHYRKVERPSRDQLKNLIRTTAFTTIAKKYNVTDNAVRRWCDDYKLPRRVAEIKKITDEDWNNL